MQHPTNTTKTTTAPQRLTHTLVAPLAIAGVAYLVIQLATQTFAQQPLALAGLALLGLGLLKHAKQHHA